jgi:tetratricopeptide (TPR) repeat protein
MISGRVLRFLFVLGAVVLVALVYWLPKNKPTTKTEAVQPEKVSDSVAFDFELYLKSAQSRLPWELGNRISKFEAELDSVVTPPITIYDSLGTLWDSAKVPGIAAWQFKNKALKTKEEKDWLNAAYRFFDAYKIASDSAEAVWFVGEAVESYESVLKINPGNLNAKTDLGVLYAEASPQPMKGITLLREVVTENPMHEQAQLNLGFLSMKSGQFDKAIERFTKVLEINHARIDMHIYLGEAYVRMGDNKKAIEQLKIFRNLTNDQEMITNVDNYIKSLENQ